MGEVAELQRGIAATSRGLARARIAERLNGQVAPHQHAATDWLSGLDTEQLLHESTACPTCRINDDEPRPEPRHYLPCPDCNDTGLIRENVLTGWLIQGIRTRTCHCSVDASLPVNAGAQQ